MSKHRPPMMALTEDVKMRLAPVLKDVVEKTLPMVSPLRIREGMSPEGVNPDMAYTPIVCNGQGVFFSVFNVVIETDHGEFPACVLGMGFFRGAMERRGTDEESALDLVRRSMPNRRWSSLWRDEATIAETEAVYLIGFENHLADDSWGEQQPADEPTSA